MKTILLLLAVSACSKDSPPPPPAAKPVRTNGEIGTPTCDALVAYERACMAALLPKYESQRAKALKDFEGAVAGVKDLFTNKYVSDPFATAEGHCTSMLEQQREYAQVQDVCPSVPVP